MSDGGGKSGIKHEKTSKRKIGGDDFVQAIAKIAVAQICEKVGFQASQQSSLGTLSDIAVRYIHSIGKAADFYANLAGRTEGNAFDIFQALEELGSAQGFLGASDVDHCLASSGIVRELIQYASEATEVPFAYPIPRLPLVKDRKPKPSFLLIGEALPSEHIPAWLPAFPDPQTYFQMTTQNETETDAHMEKIELERQQRKVEMSMLNLQQRFAGNGPEGPSSVAHGDNSKKKQVAESNPFLSAPLHFEGKEVSSVVLPAKLSKDVALKNLVLEKCVGGNHISVVDTFAPAIKAMKNQICESKGQQKSALLDQRPPVQFKIGIGKSLGKPPKFSPQNMDVGKNVPWFSKDNGKDEKKAS